MFGLYKEFDNMRKCGKYFSVAVIGVGQMGRALLAQFLEMQVIRPVVIIDHKPQRIVSSLEKAGYTEKDYELVSTVAQAENAISLGKFAIGDDDKIATACKQVELVIDATGNLEAAAEIATNSIANKKHMLMMTVETDVVIGPLLAQRAAQAGVVYSGMAGDEPGAIMELYDFAKSMGLEVLVLGKGKNNPVIYEANPETAAEEAATKEMNPRMLASFQDCTKTMVELAAVANATGFLPDCNGAHGAVSSVDELTSVLSLKQDGGVLNGYGVVEYVIGVAPGVFAIVTTHNKELQKEMRYLSMGDGPNYLIYRPYHLCSMEVPRTIAHMMMYGQATITPLEGAPFTDVVAVAKKDMQAGEMLDGIGGYTVYGSIMAYADAKLQNALPVGIVNSRTQLTRDVKKGEFLSYSDVILDSSSPLVNLRKEQDEMF